MLKQICDCGNFHIKLMPDFCSNGLWCAKCGIMLDEEETDLPEDLIKRIQEWNDCWSNYISKKRYKNYKAPKGFNEQGLKLAIEIDKYHPCLLMITEEE